MNKERHGMEWKPPDQSMIRENLERIDLRTSFFRHVEWAAC